MSYPPETVPGNKIRGSKLSVSTRDRLIVAGLERMRRYGYGATGLQELLRSTEVAKGSFYHHFDSKEQFTVAVIERYLALEAEHCQKILGNARLAPLKRLQRYFEDLLLLAGQSAAIPGCLLGGLSVEIAGVSSLLQSHLSSSFTQWQSAVAAVLREAIDLGDLPKSTRPDALAGFMLNSWEGALLRSQADRSDAPLKHFLYFVFQQLLVKRED